MTNAAVIYLFFVILGLAALGVVFSWACWKSKLNLFCNFLFVGLFFGLFVVVRRFCVPLQSTSFALSFGFRFWSDNVLRLLSGCACCGKQVHSQAGGVVFFATSGWIWFACQREGFKSVHPRFCMNASVLECK